MAKQTNIRRRGRSWVVYFRANGRQVWKSFQTKDEAELYLARWMPRKAREKYEPPKRVTFGEAADEWLRWGEHEGGKRGRWKRSTLRDNKLALDRHLRPVFGDWRLEELTTAALKRWRSAALAEGMSRRTADKLLALASGIFSRAQDAYGFDGNPAAKVGRLESGYDSGRFEFYSPEEVWQLVRAADSKQDGAIFLTAAFTGLRRGELVALAWRDVDFARSTIRVRGSVSFGELTTPKSGKVRSVPMLAEVATALARLGQRKRFTDDDDPVFPNETGGYLDGSALRRRYIAARKAAKLRELRFHDLRHTFGSLAIDKASIVQVQHWMGHADVGTTMRYLHHRSRADEAGQIADAFKVQADLQAAGVQTAATPFRTAAPAAKEIPAQVAVSRQEAAGGGSR